MVLEVGEVNVAHSSSPRSYIRSVEGRGLDSLKGIDQWESDIGMPASS